MSVREVANAVLVVLGALSFLHIFYRAVEAHWPASYHRIATGPALAITANPLGYLLFRFGPTFVVCAFTAVVLSRSRLPVLVPVLGIGTLHAATTTGRAFVNIVRAGKLRSRPLPALMHIAVSVGLVATAGLALPASALLAPAVPSLAETASDLWTALIAGVAYIVRVTQADHLSTVALLQRSRDRIPADLWEEASEQAEKHGADPTLVRAVMLVENLQRPGWFRALERLGGRFQRIATYGIMQIESQRGLSDAESIRLAVSTKFAGVSIPTRRFPGQSVPDIMKIDEFARSYNPSTDYAELIVEAYLWLSEESR